MIRSAATLGLLIFLPGCSCSETLPMCSGSGTADLTAGPEGCAAEWLHGERMCPVRTLCGRVVSCIAYSDWTAGSCDCPDAREDVPCRLAVIEPASSSVFTPGDDEDPSRPGIQVSVTVELECCRGQCAGLPVSVAPCEPPASAPIGELVLDASGSATGQVDLGEARGCVNLCAAVPECVLSEPVEICVAD